MAAISNLNNAIVETAAVTASTAGSFEFLTENQLYSSDETRRLADELAELGRVEELAALNTEELVNMIGNEGVNNLQALDTEWRELLSNVAELGLAIAAFISQYLKPVIELLNNAIGGINTRNRFESLRGDVAGTELGKQLEQAITEIRRDNGRGGRSGALQLSDMEALLKRYQSLRPVTANVTVTDQDREDFAPPKGSNKAADQLARQLAAGEKLARQFRQRVELLNAENDLQEKLIRITQQREEAEIRIKETAAASQQATLLQANAELGRLEKIKAIEEFSKKAVKDADALIKKVQEQEAAEARIKELKEQGILPALATELANLETQATKTQEKLDKQILIVESAILEAEATGAVTKELEKQLEVLKDKKKAVESTLDSQKRQAEIDSSIGGRLGKEVEDQQAKLNELLDPVNQIVGAANAIGDAFGDAFSDIVSGSKSAQEAFADMAKKIAGYFIDMAAKMIAEYVTLILMQSILNAIGGPQMGGGSAPSAPNGTQVYGGQVINTGISAAANGGPASASRPMIVGERGPELFIPSGNGRIATNAESRAALDRYTPNVNYDYNSQLSVTTGPVMQMDNDQYIKREDFERGLRQASADGAKRGEAMTLRRLKNSRSTRSTLGM